MMNEADVTTRADEDDELLVAYLDGELTGSDRRDLEQRLIDEEPLRVRLRELQAGWEMLSHLPSPTSDEHLVRTTLQLVVQDIVHSSDKIPTQKTPGLKSSSIRRWATAILVGTLVVFAVAFVLQRRRAYVEMAEWPIAMDLDAYAIGNDLELIRRLAAIPSWQRILSESPAVEIETKLDASAIESMSATQFRNQLSNLMPEPRAIASSRWERFESLPPEQRQKLKEVADQVAAADDRQVLLPTMRLYARWREQLTAETVDAIESAKADELLTAVSRGIHETLSDIARISGDNLSDEAVERMDFTLQEIVNERLRRGDRRTVAFHDWIMHRSDMIDENQSLRITVAAMVFDDMNERMTRGSWIGPGAFNRDRRQSDSPMPPPPSPLSHRELEMLVNMLPETEMDQFASFPPDEWMQAMILRQWAEETLRRKFRGKRKTLNEQYAELPAGEREVIDLLPPEQARERLSRGR